MGGWGGFLDLGGSKMFSGSSINVRRKIEKEDKTHPVLRDLTTVLLGLAEITVALSQID